MGAFALCAALAGCSDGDDPKDPTDGDGNSDGNTDIDSGRDSGGRDGGAGDAAPEPYDPNWTDFDARVDVEPDAEPPARQHVWADWTTGDVARGTAAAQFAIAGYDGGLTLSYTGGLDNIQLDGSIPYWTPGTAYVSPAVANPPVTNEMIQLAGGMNSVHTLTFSAPVKDPVLAVMSLGSRDTTTVCRFETDFDLLSHGAGYYPVASELKHLPDNKLAGRESNGAIRFKGTFTEIRWVAEISEPWYGLTVGLPTPQ